MSKANMSVGELAAEISKHVTAPPAIVVGTRFALILSVLALLVASVALAVAVSQ